MRLGIESGGPLFLGAAAGPDQQKINQVNGTDHEQEQHSALEQQRGPDLLDVLAVQ